MVGAAIGQRCSAALRYNGTMFTTQELSELATAALKDGWASGSGPLDQVRTTAAHLGWGEVPLRRGDPPVTALRPLDAGQARPNSLSAQYGKGALPLHTDGAHLSKPPDLVLLAAGQPSAVPTLLWRPASTRRPLSETAALEHGVVLVECGPDSFLCTAIAGHRLRYDPGCMTPCDERSRLVARALAQAARWAVEHRWEHPDQILLIDNRQVLHARAAADHEPDRELQRVAYRLKETTS